MSKSLGNGVDLGEQLDKFGVDAVRLTMIFASPPEDDVDWADVSPGGSAEVPGPRLARGPGSGQRTRRGCVHRRQGPAPRHPQDGRTRPPRCSRAASSTSSSPRPWSWSTRPARPSTPAPARPTRPSARPPRPPRSSSRSSPRTRPRTCGQRWATSPPSPTPAGPPYDEALLVEDSVTAVVQIKGKVRARLEVPVDITAEDARGTGPGQRASHPLPGRCGDPQGDRACAETGQHRPGLAGTRPPVHAGGRPMPRP